MANILRILPKAASRLGSNSSLLPHLTQAKWTFGSTLHVRNKRTNQARVTYDTPEEHKMVPFYWIDNIAFAATLCKMKKYTMYGTFVGGTFAYAATMEDFFGSELPLTFVIVGGTLSISLYAAGILCNRLVAGFYCKEDGSRIKVVYMDGDGTRCGDEFPTKDLIPLEELPVNKMNKYYITLRRHSCDDIYKLILQPQYVLNQELFKHVFKTRI